MQEEKNYIVAFDLGSSHIVGAAGHREDDGKFVVDAIEMEKSAGCIKRGRVINVSDTVHKVGLLKRRLENRISPSKISQVYVGVGGQSIRSVEFPLSRTISPDIPITENLLAEMETEARHNTVSNNLAVFDAIAGECRVDDRISTSPCGEYGSEIRISYRLIVGNEQHKRNLEKVFKQAKIEVAGYITTANATAAAVLSGEERQGCALLDCGAETTTLALFKDGYLVYLVTIPLGGNNITRDIGDLHITEAEAETLKCAFAPEKENELSLPDEWVRQGYIINIKPEDLKNVITSRLEEIVGNVNHQLNESRYKNFMGNGITLVGGTAQLKGLKECLVRETKLDVCRGTLIGVDKAQNINGIACTSVIGLLLSGKEVCAAPEKTTVAETSAPAEQQDAAPQTRKRGVVETIIGRIVNAPEGSTFSEKPTETHKSAPTKEDLRNKGGMFSSLFDKAIDLVNGEE